MSKLLRRSGVAVCTMCDTLEWEPDLIVQIGVGIHHQETTVFQSFWPDAELLGIEANPQVYEGIKDEYPGSLVHGAAVDTETARNSESAVLYFRRRHKDGSSLYKPPTGEFTTTNVPTTTVDQIVEQHFPNWRDRKILLWLDCEGGEYSAILGGLLTITRTVVVNVELNSKERREDTPDHAVTHALLNELGLFRTRVHTNRTTAGQFDAIYVKRSIYNPVYSCCPCQNDIH